jgi:UDP-galactopyranose mutase
MNIVGKKVLVLGGGISGGSVAWILNKLGADVTVVEKEEQCGGIGKTFNLDGCNYEIGPHILHAKKKHTIDFYEKYGVRKIEYYTKMSVDDTMDKLVDFPYSVDTIFQLPVRLGRQVVKEIYDIGRNPINYENLETYLSSVVGDTLYTEFNKGYSKKFWGKDPKKVPSSGAAKWINFRTSDKRLFMEWQGYPKGDYNSFMDWVFKDINIINANVQGVIEESNKHILRVKTSKGEIESDLYISTIPLKICFPEIKKDLTYIGNVLVVVRLERGPVFPNGIGGVYFPNKYGFKRICEYPSMTDPSYPNLKDGTLIGFEYNVFPWNGGYVDDDFYISEAIEACRDLFDQEPLSYRIHNYKDIYPLRDELQMNKFEFIQRKVDNYDNFYLSGRFGKFRYVNMNDCIEMSFDLVSELTNKTVEEIALEVGL